MGCAPSKKEPPGAPPPDDLPDAPPPDELPAEEPPDAPPLDELPDAPPPDELPVVELPAEQEQELTLLGSLSQKELLRLFGPPDEAPLPEESTWRENGGVELEALFRCTTLVDARWLLKLAKGEVLPESGGVVPAWQKLPAAAVVTVAQLRTSTMDFGLPVAVLSYGWAAKGQPDPKGAQLRSLVPVLEAIVSECAKGDWGVETWGVVWDFLSLPQRGYTTGFGPTDDRSPEQLARFGEGLKKINVWYGARFTHVLVLNLPLPADAENRRPVGERGWCAAAPAMRATACVLCRCIRVQK